MSCHFLIKCCYITFNIESRIPANKSIRYPQKTNWPKYTKILHNLIKQVHLNPLHTGEDIDLVVNEISSCMTTAYNESCPLIKPKKGKSKPW